MLRITLVANAIHLEAARRLRQREGGGARAGWRDLLVHEPRRLVLSAADRRLWPLRLAVHPLGMAALLVPALLGLVAELRLPHLHRAGRALGLLARRAGRLTLLDDGLDQYRLLPRALDPQAFAEGTALWLFSDAAAFRAPWCGRFRVGELGPLYGPLADPSADPWPAAPASGGRWEVLVLDAPGLERLAEAAGRGLVPALAGPRLVVPHPVEAKRAWRLPLRTQDRPWRGAPEPLLAASADRLVVVGESMTLLAALALRPLGSRLLVALPPQADGQLWRLVRARAEQDSGVQLFA